MINIKRKILLLASIVICVSIFAGIFYDSGVSRQHHVSRNAPQLFGTLSGFNIDALVSYKIITSDGNIITEDNIINENGIFNIPSYDYNVNSKKNHDALTYNIRVDQANRPLDISFKIRPDIGKILVSGQGLKEFSNIKMENISKDNKITGLLETKADWAGIFNEPANNSRIATGQQGRLRLAFYDNIANDGNIENPNIIELLFTSGNIGHSSSDKSIYIPVSGGNSSNASNHVQNIRNNYVRGFMLMTEQFSAIMLQQVAIVGMFFDAKIQLETQREFQKLQAEAHKDYHPSEQMCQFGSFIKTIAKTEEKAKHDKAVINKYLMNAYSNTTDSTTSGIYAGDVRSRIYQFRHVYCDPQDNNNGLDDFCGYEQNDDLKIGAQNPERMNKDINFPRTVWSPLTLDVDFTNNEKKDNKKEKEEEEEDILALSRNLYWQHPLNMIAKTNFDKHNNVKEYDSSYMNSRQLMAVKNIAHNSLAHLVSMKAKTNSKDSDSNGPSFMKALMRDFNLSDDDINGLLGEYPSYYAQMDVLTKKIYQNPNFYTNLYTKPANIDRISVSMEAIKLMQLRDQFKASLRREMLTSLMVEEELRSHHKKITVLLQ
ncbi:MAG: hypothetical protein KAJ86_00900 [Alphaproteobacteria bacterium]|nr:hypothetical protein [Alphaproteobacteria bacterium]